MMLLAYHKCALNYHGCPTILNGGYLMITQKRPTQEIAMRDNHMKTTKFMWMKINIILGKNGGYMSSTVCCSLGGTQVDWCGQAVK